MPELREEGLVGQLTVRRLGDAKVDHLRDRTIVVHCDEHVAWLEIAVDDSFLVGMLHRVAHLDEQIQSLFRCQVLGIAILGDVNALDEFHDEVGTPRLRRARIQYLGDIGMVHHRQRLTLGFEASNHLLRIHTKLDDLECDSPANGFLLVRHVHRAEPAFADELEELVAANGGPGPFGQR